MIIPVLSCPSDSSTDDWRDSLVDKIQHWSLLGKVCLTIDDTPSESLVADLEVVIKRIGGSVDLLIQCDDLSEDDALKLLNVGSSKIVCPASFAQQVQIIPDDRMIVLASGSVR